MTNAVWSGNTHLNFKEEDALGEREWNGFAYFWSHPLFYGAEHPLFVSCGDVAFVGAGPP